MSQISIQQLDERLRQLSPEKLAVVYDFVSYLIEREAATLLALPDPDGRQTALASEAALRHGWETPEEDAAWAHL